MNLDTIVKSGYGVEVGDVVLDIYTFMTFYLNPYHTNKKTYLRTVKSINSKIFSVYVDFIPTTWSGSEAFKYSKRDTERTIQQILDKVDDPYYRTDIFINIKDIDIINTFIDILFDSELLKIKTEEKSRIQKYKNEIKSLQKKIKTIEDFGMVNEINKNIFDRSFVKTQKEKIFKHLDI